MHLTQLPIRLRRLVSLHRAPSRARSHAGRRAVVAPAPDPQGRTVVVHDPQPSCVHFYDHAEFQVSSQEVVYHCAGATFTFPGPAAAGGARRIEQVLGGLRLVTDDGRVLCEIQRHLWGEDPSRRLVEVCVTHGMTTHVVCDVVETSAGVTYPLVGA